MTGFSADRRESAGSVPGQGDHTGAGEVENAEILHQQQELVDLGFSSGDLDDDVVGLHVDHLSAE